MKTEYWPYGNGRLALYSENKVMWELARSARLKATVYYQRDGTVFARQYVANKEKILWLVYQLEKFRKLQQKNAKNQPKTKECIMCGKSFIPASNRQKVCLDCRPQLRRQSARTRQQRFRDGG